jgi:pullulanase/glycogen debranching enzyme
MIEHIVKKGVPGELGATLINGGVNFSVYSKDATAVKLCLFESENSIEPSQIIDLNPVKNKTTLYPISFHTDIKTNTGIANLVSKSQDKFVLSIEFIIPILGSKIQDQTIAITTAGVINGIK